MHINPKVNDIVHKLLQRLRGFSLSSVGTQRCLQLLWKMARDRNSARRAIAECGGLPSVLKSLSLHSGDRGVVVSVCGLLSRLNKNSKIRDVMREYNPMDLLAVIGDTHDEDQEIQRLVCLSMSLCIEVANDKNVTIKHSLDAGDRACKVIKASLDDAPTVEAAMACLCEVN